MEIWLETWEVKVDEKTLIYHLGLNKTYQTKKSQIWLRNDFSVEIKHEFQGIGNKSRNAQRNDDFIFMILHTLWASLSK